MLRGWTRQRGMKQSTDRLAEVAERLLDEGRGLAPVGLDVHVLEALDGAHRLELGPRLLLNVELDAHARERGQDVREEDAAVHSVGAPGLK